jgi:hypothetical protein
MWYPEKHKPFVVLRLSSSTRSDTRKKFAWRNWLRLTKKRMWRWRPIKLKKELYQHICLIEKRLITLKYYRIWSNKREKRRQVNGKCLYKKWRPWQKQKCSRSWNLEKERNLLGNVKLIKSALSVIVSLERLLNTKDILDPLVSDLRKPMSPILPLEILRVKKNPQSALYTNLGVITKGTIIKINVSELGFVTFQ